MIPRLKPALGLPELISALRASRQSDVEAFEAAFARLMDQKYALAFPYGRTGLMLLLKALGLKEKEIICPAYTCVVVPHAVVYSGNRPVFVDCEQGGFNMDLDLAEKAINEKTGAIVATSLFGYPVNLERLDRLRARHPRVPIIQDCAHSFAAEWGGRQVQKEGVAALFGLNISKTLTSVFGGMVTTDDENLYHGLCSLRDQEVKYPDWRKGLRRFTYLVAAFPTFGELSYGVVNRLERSGLINHFVKYYDETKIEMPEDYLVGMCSLEARVGLANLTRYHRIIALRRAAAEHYFSNLQDLVAGLDRSSHDQELFILPPKIDGATYSHFVLRVRNREKWLKSGIQQGIQFGWLIEYNIPEMKSYGAYSPERFPGAANYARTTINLPVWGGERLSRKVVREIPKIIEDVSE